MNKILVTGSSGLIGSEIIREMINKEFIPYDIKLDLSQDVRKISQLPEDIEGIIHLAAISRVIIAEQNPFDCIDTNFKGTFNILNLIKNHPKKLWLIFASSREVFGEQERNDRISEYNTAKKPLQLYGVVKVAAELLCQAYSKRYNLKIRILRFSNVYTSIHDQFQRVVPNFIFRALKNQPLEINGTGEETFDFTNIKDVGRAIMLTISEIRTSRQLLSDFNIVSGESTTLLELATQIKTLCNSSSQIIYKEKRAFDVTNFLGDPTRSESVLGFRTKITLQTGLTQSIKEFQEYLHENT